MRTRDTSIVTSYLSIVLARANWRKGDLHKWITTVNIDFSSPGIHGLACKKWSSFMWNAIYILNIDTPYFTSQVSHGLSLLWVHGLYSLRRHCLIGIRISIINLRRSSDRLRFIMGIPLPIRWWFFSEQRAWVSDFHLCSGYVIADQYSECNIVLL